ncbi:MAG: integrase, partial [Oscillospiraceae bacterium]|nr:integrase [Oscillospiraceae bacterium]
MAAITAEQITEFGARLLENKRSAATVEKYTRDIRTFAEWLGENELSPETLSAYKTYLTEIRTIGGANSALS